MDSDGKPVSVDQHWKQFMEKSGKKKTVKRMHEDVMTKKKKPGVEKKSDYVFGDDDDDNGFGKGGQPKKMKKIPLKKKK